ncbi:tyrosine-type recombinase/integrase [Actinomadura rupiterrae]|uniref:tyrosine-type recombinase/integrase n=1 Tax=Actinomadura rupiterrae TaxID=559627 RepID=UPI0020A44D2C|nr:tyrosine-type recombinase/integrase [Actinomadura rupiterrae]MCP2343395.1 integrase [Actinomadura rupiterrae]
MPYSHDVNIWKLARKKRKRGHGVRWIVAKREFDKWFTEYALADNHRSKLMQAARRGEGFDTETGLPESMVREQLSVTWFELACRYVDLKWPDAAPKSRTGIADALATVTPVMVATERGRPDPQVLREALYGWAFHKVRRETTELTGAKAAALDWLRANSLKVVAINEREQRSQLVRRALDAIALRLDGAPAAAKTVARKRAIIHGVFGYAVELDILPSNPIDRIKWKAPAVAEEVNRNVLANPKQIRALLDAVKSWRPELVAFYGCLYYAYTRPGEAKLLCKDDCVELPDKGWGLILLGQNAPRVGADWTDTGNSHEARQLKHRAKKTTRPVPIPPELVRLLRHHLDEYGTASDGRLFSGGRGGPLSESVYGRVWRKAREQALTPSQVASPLAGRPYDLRHSGVTLALNSGVPAPEVARRAGHGVEVLLRVYAGCIDGHDGMWNDRITDALRDDDDHPEV